VEASLARQLWIGPVEEAAEATEAAMQMTAAFAEMQQDYGKLLDDGLADVVLVVKGERFPAHRGVLAARSEYFWGLFLSEMQGGSSEGGVQEIEQVSAGALRVVLRYLYTAELPESGSEGLVQEGEERIFYMPFVAGTANRDNLRIGGMRELCDRLGAKKELEDS
jgi:hypothetical protein